MSAGRCREEEGSSDSLHRALFRAHGPKRIREDACSPRALVGLCGAQDGARLFLFIELFIAFEFVSLYRALYRF